MFLRAFLDAVPVRGEADRAVLAVHATMLEHGFICVGGPEPHTAVVPPLVVAADGSASFQVLPASWNASQDSFAFGYAHPMRGSEETFTVKALYIGSSLQVHAASSLQAGELLSATLDVSTTAPEADIEKHLQTWQEKISANIALKLLGKNNSTARFGKVLTQEQNATVASGAGTKRPAPPEPHRIEDDDDGRGGWRPGGRFPDPGRSGIFVPPGPDPFSPSPNPFWMPGGGLLGPRHPAWGQNVPVGGRGGAGMMPRFDPIGPGMGPGMGEPDPDHLRVPGIPGDPRFPGGNRGRFDPHGMSFS